MGENAERVQRYLRDGLSERDTGRDWKTEYPVGNTPVDIVGRAKGNQEGVVLIEVEWRRADPADNTAKLFRHAFESKLPEGGGTVYVFQAFTRYYELSDGGLSSKRKNAEFVGKTASRSLRAFEYTPLSLGVSPPKRGDEVPEGWRSAADSVAEEIADGVRG